MKPTNVILGCQWGDEGKGKVVDRMAEHVDLVVRFQGGANAGHTVYVGDEKFVLHLLPTGVLRDGVQCLLGPGMVVDPWTLVEEIDELSRRGIDVEQRVRVAGSAQLVMPYHRRFDELREQSLASKSIGTTGRGIGPAYEDKMARLGLRVADLTRPDSSLRRLVIEKVLRANRLLAERHDAPAMASEALADEVLEHAERLRPMVVSAYEFLDPVRRGQWTTMLEGAQGALLDVDHGTFPFVTASSCTVGGAITGTGLSHRVIDSVFGVFKGYGTRVGNGPFVTELHGEEAEDLRSRGSEFGATTGRPRRCGWFDAVAGRYATEINGLDQVVLTKLDVLSGIDTLKICTAYEHEGAQRDHFPNWVEVLEKCKPVYEEIPGWSEDIGAVTSWDDLPANCRAYVERLGDLLGTPVTVVSNGPTRDHWIERPVG
ncbi:MAG TPA: adenylosuccinate synthase [Candidatus Krumholzibacteria bacterium]|nr:adenylosuccinate synthase [Candidatus Krumholzibacteria bacterium]